MNESIAHLIRIFYIHIMNDISMIFIAYMSIGRFIDYTQQRFLIIRIRNNRIA